MACFGAAFAIFGRETDLSPTSRPGRSGSARVEQIPVIWELPERLTPTTKLVIWLPAGLATMETARPVMLRLAAVGYLAVSFDSWERGSRSTEALESLMPRVWANFPQVAWPLYGNGALELMRVADWAARAFGVTPPFAVGGVSAGGDIAVAAAGLDPRMACVAAVVATPDWRRPGMHVDGQLVGSGEPDAYAAWLYERINPITNPGSYAHRPAMLFECGAQDDHVPADGAQRFQQALAPVYALDEARIRVTLHSGVGHDTVPEMLDNCMAWLRTHVPPDER